jgi:predicted polyphosphate/ATP-dependent NAD kinase
VLGLIVNPVAGMGGAVGLRGTDGDAAARAQALGAQPLAATRTSHALAHLARALPELRVVAAADPMGAALARAHGWQVDEVLRRADGPTTAADTRAAAAEMAARGVRLLLFAGGDGTARDVVQAVGTSVPVLGVPTGVKMHSAVFATSPRAAGELAARFLTAGPGVVPLREREVVDVDEQARREDRLSTRLHGVACVPYARERLQRSKAAPAQEGDAALDAACRSFAEQMQPGRLHVLGPGTTTAQVLAALGLTGSLTGIDAVRDGVLVGTDLSERELLALLDGAGPVTVVLGVVGGQGFLLGRGNQQLSARVLERVAVDDVVVLASAAKLSGLDPPVLHVDLGDPEQEQRLSGYRRVRTGPTTSTVLQVVC